MTSVDFLDTQRLIWSHFRSFGSTLVKRWQTYLYYKHATLITCPVLFLYPVGDSLIDFVTFCKQCLHDFMKTNSSSPNLSKSARADISILVQLSLHNFFKHLHFSLIGESRIWLTLETNIIIIFFAKFETPTLNRI